MATTGSRRGPAVRRHGRVRTATGAHRASSSARFASTSTRIVSTSRAREALAAASRGRRPRPVPERRHAPGIERRRTRVARYHRQPPRTGSAAPRPRSDRDRCASSIEQRPVRLHVDPDRLHEPRPRSAGSRFTWTSTATGARAAPRARHRTAPNQGSQVPPAAAATGRAALRPCSDRARCASSIERRPVRLHAARIASTPRPRPRPRAAPGS